MDQQRTLGEQISINADEVATTIERFIREKVEHAKKDGVVLGLSGGLDSAVIATLAGRAIGGSRVHALYMFDRDSQGKFRLHAEMLARNLGLNFESMDISRSVKEQSTYKPLIMRMVPLSSLLNRWVLFPTCRIIYRIVFGETPFTMGLLQWAPAKNSLVNSVHSLMARPVEDGFNTRHILRRKILVQYALDKNLLLIGAANRSEAFAGLFIKDGVDDLPIEPLIGLYKTQVRQLARHLQIPQAIVREHPSPDMFKGITDEDLLGYSYEKIDKVAYVLDRGLSEDSLFREGITPNELEDIKRLNCISAWKRNSVHESPNLEPG